MEDSTTKEKVLKKIRASLLSKSPNPFPKLELESSVFKISTEDVVVEFGTQVTQAGGKFFLVADELEFATGIVDLGIQHLWKNIVCIEEGLSNLLYECDLPHSCLVEDIETMNVAITGCECAIIRSGSIVLSSKNQTRTVPAYAPVHIVLVKASQLVNDMKEMFTKFKNQGRFPSALSIITGPSKTADIGGVTVTGAHGPKQLYVFLIDDRKHD
ncbi:MAG: lactate utilization protein C [Bacteroidota bacterium]